jgi:hypothetical protein
MGGFASPWTKSEFSTLTLADTKVRDIPNLRDEFDVIIVPLFAGSLATILATTFAAASANPAQRASMAPFGIAARYWRSVNRLHRHTWGSFPGAAPDMQSELGNRESADRNRRWQSGPRRRR